MLLAIMRIVLLVPLCVNKTYENAACNNDSHFAQASMYKKKWKCCLQWYESHVAQASIRRENAACNNESHVAQAPMC